MRLRIPDKGFLDAAGYDIGGAAALVTVSGTLTKTTVASATSSTTLLAANANRYSARIVNGANTNLYVNLLGATATAADTLVKPGDGIEISGVLIVKGIWDATPTGNANVAELVI